MSRVTANSLMSSKGSEADIWRHLSDVRFTPHSLGYISMSALCQKRTFGWAIRTPR